MYPNIFGVEFLHSYGLMIGIGVVVCLWVFDKYSKKLNLDPKFIEYIEWVALIAIIGGVFGGYLFQAFYNYLDDPEGGFNFGSGITFLGGLIFGAVTFLICYFIRRNKYQSKFFDMSGIAACCITVAHGFGRIGCFMAGCCYGKQTDSWIGIDFPYGASMGKVYPTQLFEALFLFLMFGIISYLLLKKKYKFGFETYLIGYGVWRFFIEFLRDDDRGKFIGNLSPSQFWSIIMALIGIALIVIRVVMDKNKKAKLKEVKE